MNDFTNQTISFVAKYTKEIQVIIFIVWGIVMIIHSVVMSMNGLALIRNTEARNRNTEVLEINSEVWSHFNRKDLDE